MSKPAFVKLGGSVITDKAAEGKFKRAQTKRLLAELAKAEIPLIVFHGAGGYAHPPAKRAGFGVRTVRTKDATETLAAANLLHAQVVSLAEEVGLNPVSIPLHLTASSDGGQVVNLPVERIINLRSEGCTPILTGTIVRTENQDWRVVSADELMSALAPDFDPRLGLFVTDVDGVFDRDPNDANAKLLATVSKDDELKLAAGHTADVTGHMAGKVARARELAGFCPTLILNGNSRGRVLAALKGKTVPSTRFDA